MSNTKDCIVCGSVIKKNARKCPYCKAEQTHRSYTSPHTYGQPEQNADNRQRHAQQHNRRTSYNERPANKIPLQASIIMVIFAIIVLIGVFSVIFANLSGLSSQSTPQRDPAHIAVPENMTVSQEKALNEAHKQLEYFDISYQEIVETLQWMGYSYEDATFAADYCGADWNDEALGCAQSYVDYSAFSYTGLINQLIYDGFTEEQARWGANNCDVAWFEEALECAESYLEYCSISYKSLTEQLEFEGFAESEIEFAMQCCEADWAAEALECAKSYLEYADFSRDELIAQLEYEGFLPEKARYGADGALSGK